MCNEAGFTIEKLCVDREFKSIMNLIMNDLNVMTDYSNINAHVFEAERNTRVIKERVRALLHHLHTQSGHFSFVLFHFHKLHSFVADLN